MPKQKSAAHAASGGPVLTGTLAKKDGTVIAHLTKDDVMSMIKTHAKPQSQMSVSSDLPSYAKMMADPLEAPLAALPDESNYATNVMRLPDVVAISGTDTVALVTPTLLNSHYTAPTITSGALTSLGTATDSTWRTTINNDNVLNRTLVFVVQWQPTFSMQTGAGRVRMGLYQGSNSTNGVTLGGQLSSYFDDGGMQCQGPANEPCVVIVRPTQKCPLLTADANLNQYFPNILVTFTGMPAGNCGQLIITRIVEASPYGGNLPAQTAKYSPCDPMSCCVASNLQTVAVTAHASEEDPYEVVKRNGIKFAKAAVVDIAKWGMGTFMPNVSKLLGG